MFRLDKKTAVVTGAGSGIGKAIAITFAKQGALVHILELDAAKAAETVAEIEAVGGKAFTHTCNVTSQPDVIGLFNAIGAVHILANIAGIAHIGKADTTSEADFDRLMQVNVKGVYNCIYAAIPALRKAGGGSI
ncbi:MAG TPA: SDR family NAD(P)-dependent oxidoreductase, partial [Ferruginibacter sp.]|nr:SDR family NAD(P)-dependent oxidoreductase [Ferruginibacter sp.]